MLIDVFVQRMSRRFPTYLKTEGQIREFERSCQEKLKPWQGETLGFVFHEFDEAIRNRAHPVMAQILDMCRQKEKVQRKATHQARAFEVLSTDDIIEQFKNSLTYGPCCVKLIARSIIMIVEKDKKIPNEFEIRQMEEARTEYLNICRGMKSGDIPDPMKLYQIGCGLYLKDVELLREHLMLNPLPDDYRRPTFEEHKNRDMDFPMPHNMMLDYDHGPDQLLERVY